MLIPDLSGIKDGNLSSDDTISSWGNDINNLFKVEIPVHDDARTSFGGDLL